MAREPRRLELKRKSGDSSQVKQSFSHGRSKTVQVEVRKKRSFPRGGQPATEAKGAGVFEAPETAKPEAEPQPVLQPRRSSEAAAGAPAKAKVRHVLPTLSEAEKAARARALEDAMRADEESRRRAEEEAERRSQEEARLATEREAAERRRLEEEERKRGDEAARRRAEEDAERRLKEHESPAEAELAKPARPALREAAPAERLRPESEAEATERAKRAPSKTRTPPVRRGEQRRRSGRLTVTQALSADEGERMRSLASVRRERERHKQERAQHGGGAEAVGRVIRDVVIPEAITVQELANRMAERARDVIRVLMSMGVMATINQSIDADTAELVVAEFGHRSKRVSEADVEVGLRGAEDDEAARTPRPPVVTVMGHVDHGKTSLLDAIRKSDIAAGEAGGITQHIGAYQVETRSGGRITFLDTPGHEAFTAMRARGAKVTDIVVLVVAADDGVMPQTVEAINHAKAAKVPMIVAINKIDRPDANPDRVKQELLQHEIVVEDMGGDVQTVNVSATQRLNIDQLEDAILLQAEVLELKANPDRPAEGVVVEAKLDRGRGSVATVLVERGTLRVGDVFVAGLEWGRVRALIDSYGRNVSEAGPTVPVEVLGLNGTPLAGDEFTVVESEARAREVTAYRQRIERDRRVAIGSRSSVEQMFNKIRAGEKREVAVVVKGDVHGSVEAIVNALEKLGTEEVAVRVLHAGVGGITESDMTLANASDALVIGFNVRANAQARELSRREGIDIRYYSIIYELVDDMKAMLSGLLAPEVRETVIGTAQVLEVFSITKLGKVAGCRVTSGVVRRNARVRLLRDDVVIHEGGLKSLKRFKDDVREVREGNECGISLENYQDIQVGDVLEVFEVEEVQRSL